MLAMSKNNFSYNEKSTTNVYEQQIRKIAEVLGLGSPFPSGEDLMMCCPIHYEENPSFGMNTVNGTLHCFACEFKGHISKLPYYLRSNILAEKTDSIEEFEVTVKIDTVSYYVKPSGGEVGSIRNRLATVPLSKYTIKDLVRFITTGHTVSLSGAKKNDEWQWQQVVMIDIDNECQITFTEILNFAKSIRLEPTFAYHTYSSTENCCRCRFAYVFKEPITDKQIYSDILKQLIEKFADYSVDPACADLCRMFYGTLNTEVYISNLVYYNRFSAEQINEVESIIGNGHKTKCSCTKSKISGVISSSEDTYNEFFNGKYFLHHVFGQYMIDNYNIIRLNNNQLHIYKDGIYENNSVTHDIETEMSTLIPRLNNKQIDETMGYICRMSKREVESDYRFIAYNNRHFEYCYNELYGFYARYYSYK